MNTTYPFVHKTLRHHADDPTAAVRLRFNKILKEDAGIDALFLNRVADRVIGWADLRPERPVLREALNEADVAGPILEALGMGGDGLILDADGGVRFFRHEGGSVIEVVLPELVRSRLGSLRLRSDGWVGRLCDDGAYEFDPRTPSPGTHFRANLLLGDRCGFPHALMTTPKALVDEWGRGSSRSHADKQVLATRWDVQPEENGFPANRQFYLVEGGRQIFYSAAPGKDARVSTIHAANRTVIRYELADGLRIERTIFVVPAEDGLPLATEAQFIRINNSGRSARRLGLVLTGMFGYPHPGALTVDVIYTCVTVEPGTVAAGVEGPFAVAPRYTAAWGGDDRPLNFSVVRRMSGRAEYPSSFCLDYRKFIGSGSIEQPEHVAFLDNAYPRKGPAFFALGFDLPLEPGESVECESYNSLVSRHEGGAVTDAVLEQRISAMADWVLQRDGGHKALERVVRYQEAYSSAVQVRSPAAEVDRLVNVHLPFQIRYQTYASRSFALTQKGFRQIGFREIQDLFAAMPFEVASGRARHVIDLLGVWASHVHRFGYADHQFYWTGVEPGRYSDDALWLFQAIGRYIDLTGDASILHREWPVAGEQAVRRLFDTLQAILVYSGRISIGRNGMPLIDHADWNDTLNLDGEGLHGPEKEVLYRKQVAEGVIREGEGLKTDLSESVMNGFLLEIARDYMVRFARMLGDTAREREWTEFGTILRARLQKAWKGDFFARCFVNRPNDAGIAFFGAAGDGLSADPGVPGAYFLNSFSWSVLSGIATDEQIATMLERLENVLLTPVGLRLSSPAQFRLLMPHAGSGDYAYGDRENGAVFKHANMMAVVALQEAARRVADEGLAEKLAGLAWRVLRVTAPFVAFNDPYRLGGNPRFCTQYTNPATQEHIGPLLSGTAPWMWLAYMNVLGVRFRDGRVELDPLLPPHWTEASVDIRAPAGCYRIHVEKPVGFRRSRHRAPTVTVDGQKGAQQMPVGRADAWMRAEVVFQ